MDGTVVSLMDAVFDQATQVDVDAEMNAAKKAGHVEEIEAPENADIAGYCAENGLVLPLNTMPSAREMKVREDDTPMTQEPIE